jgi:hypothetical protein
MYKLKFILFVFLGVLSTNCFSDEPPVFFKMSSMGESKVMRTRVMIAPVLSFYTINKNHASNPRQKMSGLVSIKEEVRLNVKHNMFFAFGVEYMVHGVNFNSYYFKPDSIQLYTGDMNYAYSLYIHEIDIPLQLKLCFNHENNARVTPYFMIGYHLRTLLDANLKVSRDGETVYKTYEVVTFKNKLFTSRNNPFVSVTLGIQKNNLKTYRNCVFAELTYRYGFSPYLVKDSFTASSLYISGNHLNVGFGFKF